MADGVVEIHLSTSDLRIAPPASGGHQTKKIGLGSVTRKCSPLNQASARFAHPLKPSRLPPGSSKYIAPVFLFLSISHFLLY